MAFCGLGSPGIVVFHKLQSDSLNEVSWYANVLLSRVTRFARDKNKQGPYNEAYICFFINPPIPFMSLLCTIVSIFPLWIRISRWHSMRHMFGFSLIQHFPFQISRRTLGSHYVKRPGAIWFFTANQRHLLLMTCVQRPMINCRDAHISSCGPFEFYYWLREVMTKHVTVVPV